MKLMNRILATVIVGLFPIILFGKTTYIGDVVFPDSLSYPYSIILHKNLDVVFTYNFSTKNYSFTTNKDVTDITFSSLGFAQSKIKVEKSSHDTIMLPTIFFKEDAKQLNEVVVTSNKAVVRSVGMNYTISNIRGSYIGNSGNLMDMLRWTPGISVTNNETISVLGRGDSPLIYINGVKVMGNFELNALTSSNVDKIEIIRDPGAEYPMGTSSVILITTVKPREENINVELNNNSSFRRAFSNLFRTTTFGRINKVNFNASISYNLIQDKQSANYRLETFTPSGENDLSQLFDQSRRAKNHQAIWFMGANYTMKKSVFQLQYSGSYSNNNSFVDIHRSTVTPNGTIFDPYTAKSKGTPDNHNIIGYSSIKLFKGTLKFTAAYSHRNNYNIDRYDGETIESNSFSQYDYKYNMVTFKADYSHKLSKFGSHSYGAYLGYSNNYMHLDDSNQIDQSVNGDSKWAEAYYSIKWKYKKINVQGGLRGRYEYDTNADKVTSKKSLTYTNVSPRIAVNYTFSNDYILSGSYDLSYKLPSFRQINPALRLSNLIFYTQGNPSLKQAHTNRYNITANLKGFTITSEYYDFHNDIVKITEPYGDGTFISRPQNMKKSTDMLLSVEYNVMPNPKTRIYARVAGDRTNIQYIYRFQEVKTIDYSVEVDLNASYQLGKFSVFLDGRYNSPQRVNTIKISHCFDLNVGADYSMLKNRLYIRLEAQDLLNRSVTPSWQEFSPGLYQYRRNRYDTRGVTLMLRYRFTSVRSKFKGTTQSRDDSRMD